ncbi:hypothetical protein N8I77_002383 [Diaporthe amygdali]|uniref:Plus3 domain-containing protein n=1 Tax=Phomopsis amygdali TaxID=1214568 RepID=A0AAD9SSU7_PHOAM|nr:hypothetical protein N8I77_002383 [Diaporthe amygdali]KAK2615643.1 hypothetical protein N8I77_002383 [Diaporthe amygdali]
MSDFGDPDDMLLALAGGGDGSSDEASDAGSRGRSRSRSRGRSQSRSQSRSRGPERSESAQPAERSSPRSPATKKTPAKKSQGRNKADSEDEGEASDPGTPRSQSSVPMDESDSDAESDAAQGKEPDEGENRYPVEGLYKSYEEKEEIMAMREFERERILEERHAERNRAKTLATLRQMVQNTEQGEKQKKRKAGAAELEEGQRKTSRPRTTSKTTKALPTALDNLKRARAEKQDRRRKDEERRRDRRSPSYRSGSSRSRSRHSDDSDVEWAGATKKRSKTPERALPAELRDIERCRLSRTRFAKLNFWPGFEETVKGCYIRIHIGPDPNTRQPVYRMAVIKGVTTGRPYAVENEQHKTIVTDQYVIGAHGKAEKEWPYIACSESPFTEAEWNRYQIVCGKDSITIPKKPELAQKVDDINRLLNRSWTDEELSEKLKRQTLLRDKFSGAERARLEQEIAEARRHGNDTLADELQENLDKMPAPRLAFSTTLKKASPVKPSGPTQQDRLAEKNRLNRQLNAKQVREAQIAERRKAREVLTDKGGDDTDGGDPSSRRAGARKKFAAGARDGGGGNNALNSTAGSGASTPANGTPKLGAQNPVPPHVAKLREQQEAAANGKGGVPKIHRALTDDDIIGSLDLDIDVEI